MSGVVGGEQVPSEWVRLVERHSGLRLAYREWEQLQPWLSRRLHTLGLSEEAYRQRLLQGREESEEWELLQQQLTVGESYFFRDRGQFHLLQHHILPQLVEANRYRRRLVIWSAGCSRGEELYSIAILLLRLLPDAAHWRLHLLGTDIVKDRLEQARQGGYSSWSLRALEPEQLAEYFSPQGKRSQLRQPIRQRCRFEYHNLATDTPRIRSLLTEPADLIVCRNVLIYFGNEVANRIVELLGRELSESGCLMVGHTELLRTAHSGLVAHSFPESILYYPRPSQQRAESVALPLSVPLISSRSLVDKRTGMPATPEWPPLQAPEVVRAEEPPLLSPAVPDSSRLFVLFQQGAYRQLLQQLQRLPELDERGRLLQAEAQANLGEYDEAEKGIVALLEQYPFSALGHYLGGHLRLLRGDGSGAIKRLEKAIYLDEGLIPAYLDLAAELDREERTDRAERMRRAARRLLQRRQPQERIPPYDALTAAELLELVESHLCPHRSLS